eukprot:TRINITY_DN52_c0_g2_i1.p1 TRINITY_DN52_c0_g2~~TRINITY_DN52_c0_g2_i1.p1  ORF type:complete len:213 (+),score=27.64 TRINITY_DN52_c0_g2_i1:185-823(+)
MALSPATLRLATISESLSAMSANSMASLYSTPKSLSAWEWQTRSSSSASCSSVNAGSGERRNVQVAAASSAGVTEAERFTSPKFGAVGEDRFREGAASGTYWGKESSTSEEVTLVFQAGDGRDEVTTTAFVGENLLRVAERCGVMVPTTDFCYEGTCCQCEMEVKGGAPEVGYRADPSAGDLVRSCICMVPSRTGPVEVSVMSEEGAWADVL